MADNGGRAEQEQPGKGHEAMEISIGELCVLMAFVFYMGVIAAERVRGAEVSNLQRRIAEQNKHIQTLKEWINRDNQQRSGG